MNPQTIATIKERPEFQELLAFLASEAEKLNDLSALKDVSGSEVAFRAFANIEAKKTIDAMLAPLLAVGDKPAGVDPREFVVE